MAGIFNQILNTYLTTLHEPGWARRIVGRAKISIDNMIDSKICFV